MLAKLKKEYETLSNRVRFILGVISEEIKINKVKRRVLIQKLKSLGFNTISELNTILNENKKVTVVQNSEEKIDQDEGEIKEGTMEIDEVLADGEIPAKEYDYLLTMPMWSLTDEKVEEL